MNTRSLFFLVISILIFAISFVKVSNDFSQEENSVSEHVSFALVQNYFPQDPNHKKILSVEKEGILRIKVSSQVAKGSMTFTVLSPDNKVVYRKEGQLFYDIETLPVTQGEWQLVMESDYAEKGSYFFKAEVRNDE